MCVLMETFWVVRMRVGEHVLLSSSGQRPDMLLNILLYSEQPPTPMSILMMLTNPALEQ